MMDRVFGTVLGQILAIIASSSAVTFVLFLIFLSTLYPSVPPPPPWPWPNAYRIAALIDTIRTVPEHQRAAVIAAAERPDLSIRQTTAPAVCGVLSSDARDMQTALTTELYRPSVEITVRSCEGSASNVATNIQILAKVDGQMLEIRTGKSTPAHFSKLTFPLVGALLFLCVAVAAMSAWAVWRVIRPLRRLSEKADAFGRDVEVAPIEEQGPLEIRRATRAFNLMQERITRSIRDRTRMLAAISHDLRTPLTRMRLLLETNPATEPHRKLLQNIDLMQSMVASALAFLSGSLDQEEKEWLDLGALLLTLSDEFEEAGSSVCYVGPEQLECFCRPNAMTRAMTNLIENACHFGSEVTIKACVVGDKVIIDVEDDGPGIPSDHKQDVVEPFVRLDPARADRPGSVGLGLSIVQEVVSAHNGTLALLDRKPKGLIARITLPHPLHERRRLFG